MISERMNEKKKKKTTNLVVDRLAALEPGERRGGGGLSGVRPESSSRWGLLEKPVGDASVFLQDFVT